MMHTSTLSDDDQDAIMASLEAAARTNGDLDHANRSSSVSSVNKLLPDVLSTELQSLDLFADHESNRISFLLLDGNDCLTVEDFDGFCRKLGCDATVDAKVVSVIGNSGEGKSFALNQIFFPKDPDTSDKTGDNGEGVFPTSSSSMDRCTNGVWAAFEPGSQSLVLDTEGMLGIGPGSKPNETRRNCQLLKILAISDLVICKTRAERIQSDLLYFLGDASKAYNNHFSNTLKGLQAKTGPTVIIFHETRHTQVLQVSNGKTPEMALREQLLTLDQDISAFSQLRYFGVKRNGSHQEDEKEIYASLRKLVLQELQDSNGRSPRNMSLIFKTMVALSEKFSGGSETEADHRSIPDEYFTCRTRCSSCGQRCQEEVNHESNHKTGLQCVFSKALSNRNYLCLRCCHAGRRNVVVPKASSAEEGTWVGLAMYAWSGFVLECRTCGVIYRSRQNWFGNESPETTGVVQVEISHIWPGVRSLQGTHNAARRLLDGVNCLSSTVSAISTAPSRTLTGWVADRIAPTYWRPNADITNCHLCDKRFDGTNLKIHHCRACGEGFCDTCSDFKRPVPERGWAPDEPVRVCKNCYGPLGLKATRSRDGEVVQLASPANPGADDNVLARKYGEKMAGTLNNLASVVLDYPLSALKDTARPDYWVPDEECTQCCVCQVVFDSSPSLSVASSSSSTLINSMPKIKLHHCRQCGQGVCDSCSRGRKPVSLRGWDTPVRVCDSCVNIDFVT